MLPAIITVIPALVGIAEKLFRPSSSGEKTGSQKFDYVLAMVEAAYDKMGAKLMPDIPHFDEKAWVMGCARVTIEEAVKAIKAVGAA